MTRHQPTKTLTDLLAPHVRRVEEDLDRWLVEPDTPEALARAMRYCVQGGGKRLRPGLVFLSCEAVGGDTEAGVVRRCAIAVELVHTYSLVHDDLPAIDDDELRRGRPTAHVRFGEAMAILVGDALLTRAFAVLAPAEGEAGSPGRLAAELARAAGSTGMIAGQVADMDLCRVPAGAEGLHYIHSRKTAALICAAVRMGALCGGADDDAAVEALSRYGERLGLAFQLTDDLLDVLGTTEEMGKSTGKDAEDGKRTYAAEVGVGPSLRRCEELTAEAIAAAEAVGPAAEPLRALAELLAHRTH